MKRIKWIFFLVSVFLRVMMVGDAWSNTFDLDGIDTSVDVGETSSNIALDSDSNQGICYHNQTNRALQFAYFDGNDWQIETVDGNDGRGKDVGAECALVFDDQDRPHIVYFNNTDGEIRHAYHDGLLWRIVIVDDDADYDVLVFGAHRLSLKRNPLGGVGIAYYDLSHRDLVFGEWDGQDWAFETVENQGDSGRYPSLAYTTDGRPAISYMRHINNNRAELKYVEFDGHHWTRSMTVDDEDYAGRYSSLVFDSNNVPHVAYHHAVNNVQSLRYTNRVGGQWNEYFTVEEGGVAFASAGEYAQITISPAGHVHIIYRYYFFSALFGRAFYLKMSTLYFASIHAPDEINSRQDNLMVSVAATRNYYGMSVDMDDNYHLVYSAVIENAFFQTDALYAGELQRWSPYAEYVTSEDVAAENDRVSIRWRDFDPDSDAKIRFAFRQGVNDAVNIEGTISEDDRNDRVTLDTSGLEPGRYNLVMEISDDNFVMSNNGSWSSFQVIVPERAEPEPVQQQEEQQAPAQNQQADQAQEHAAQEEPAQEDQQQNHLAENQAQQNPADQNQPQQRQQNNQQQNIPQLAQQQQNQPQVPQANPPVQQPAQPVQQQQQQQQADSAGEGNAADQQPQEEALAEEETPSAPAAAEPVQPQSEPEQSSEPAGSTANSDTDKSSSGFELNLPKIAASCSLSASATSSGVDGSLIGMMIGVVGLIVVRKHSSLDGRV